MSNKVFGYHNELWRVLHEFQYTGTDQPFTLDPGEYLFICHGARGGSSSMRDAPEYGAVVYGELDLTETTTFHAVVGGVGGNGSLDYTTSAGGFNGGAPGSKATPQIGNDGPFLNGNGGGGASDIRLIEYDADEYPTYDENGNMVFNKSISVYDDQDPDHPYTKLDYIFARGNGLSGYFDTGYTPISTTKVLMDCVLYPDPFSSYEGLFGARTSGETNYAFSFTMRYNNKNTPSWSRNGGTVFFSSDFPYNERIQLECEGLTAKVYSNDRLLDSVTITNGNAADSECSLCINAINAGGGSYVNYNVAKFKLYSFKIWDTDVDNNEVLQRDYTPVIRNSDGTVGLFDQVSKTFITPTSTGYWEPGPYAMDTPSLNSRIMVAAGGGGAINMSEASGYLDSVSYGGGAYGTLYHTKISYDWHGDLYASQTNGFGFGYGDRPPDQYQSRVIAYSTEGSSGGGGGWYGGYARRTTNDTAEKQSMAGAGGSSYVLTNSSYKPLLCNGEYYEPGEKYHFHDTLMIAGCADLDPVIYICQKINSPSQDDVITFPCVGETEHVTLPPGTYELTCYGGDGRPRFYGSHVSSGGYASGTLELQGVEDIYVNVGGSGGPPILDIQKSTVRTNIPTIGFNGGGNASYDMSKPSLTIGGGGSDIRIGSNSLYARVIVAGGAGSEGGNGYTGGDGGGSVGGTQLNGGCAYRAAQPGTQTESPQNTNNTYKVTNGGFGFGGNGIYASGGYGGSGGGGWYGGSGTYPDYGSDDDQGGAGGSGYVLTEESYKPDGYLLDEEYYLTNTSLLNGTQVSMNKLPFHSYIKITAIDIRVGLLCRDEEGVKYFDEESGLWVLCPTQGLTKSTFEQYGYIGDDISVAGLLETFDILTYDGSHSKKKVNLKVVPPKQHVRIQYDNSFSARNTGVDAEYDPLQFEITHKLSRDTLTNNSVYDLILDKILNDDETCVVYSSQIFNTGTKGSNRYISPEEANWRSTWKKPDDPSFFDEAGQMIKAQYLLPVGKRNNVNIKYRNGIIDSGVTNIFYTSMCEHHRSIYIGMTVQFNDDWSQVYFICKKLNVMNGQLETVCKIPHSGNTGELYKIQYDSSSYVYDSHILVNDDYLFLAISNQNYYYKINLKTKDVTTTALGYVSGSYTLAGNGGCKIKWYDKQKTIIASGSYKNLILYNTIKDTFTNIEIRARAGDFTDFSIGDKCILTGYNKNLYVYNKSTNTYVTKSNALPYSGNNTYFAYHNGVHYIAQYGYISEYHEDTDTLISHAVSGISQQPNNCEYANDCIFVTMTNNNRQMIIYDIKNSLSQKINMRWNLENSLTNGKRYYTFEYDGYIFLLKNTLLMLDYNKQTTYNMGYRYARLVNLYNTETEPQYTYDSRFIQFDNACLKFTNATLTYPLSSYGGNHVASATINKSDFKRIIKISYET